MKRPTYPRRLSRELHEQRATEFQKAREDLRDFFRELDRTYGPKSRISTIAHRANKALDELRSEMSEAWFHEHPNMRGFSHWDIVHGGGSPYWGTFCPFPDCKRRPWEVGHEPSTQAPTIATAAGGQGS